MTLTVCPHSCHRGAHRRTLILVMPRLLNLVVAIYLIFIGLIGLGLLKWLHM